MKQPTCLPVIRHSRPAPRIVPLMRAAIFFLFFLSIGGKSHAQTPTYSLPLPGAGSDVSIYAFGSINGDTGIRWQTIYQPTRDFYTAPATGLMKAVYFRVGAYATPGKTSTYHDLSVKMGYTTRTEFHAPFTLDTLVKGLTQVFRASSIVLVGDAYRKWIRLPLNATGFMYDKTKNFVVEIGYGNLPQNGFDLLSSTSGKGVRTRGGSSTSDINKANGLEPLDFGFDFTSVGVDAVNNISSIGMFPNPATDGHFNISLEAKQAISEVSVKVSSATGQQVLYQSFRGTGNVFFKEVNISEAASGIYFVEIMADGERLLRRLILQ